MKPPIMKTLAVKPLAPTETLVGGAGAAGAAEAVEAVGVLGQGVMGVVSHILMVVTVEEQEEQGAVSAEDEGAIAGTEASRERVRTYFSPR